MNDTFANHLIFAREQDAEDVLRSFRDQFYFPVLSGKQALYFCGNSLGLQPKKVKELINQDLADWAAWGVEGHLNAKTPWFSYHEYLRDPMAKVVGAFADEVVVMNSLTTNLHLMMISFYRPDKKRYKIICEAGAFPSDQYALASQAQMHGFNPKEAVIELIPEQGEDYLRTEKIIEVINRHKDSLALVMLGGVNYYTGQLFDMKAITKAAHEAGALAGFDLAHAAGNALLQLHDWNVDFAVWCSYKYLNAGPGGVAGAFVNRRHCQNQDLFRLAGWWGNDPKTRFDMPTQFIPVKSADAWQLSNAPVLSMAALKASLDLFEKAGMNRLREKSCRLTAYMQYVIEMAIANNHCSSEVKIITPPVQEQRGCQLSVRFKTKGKAIYDFLLANQVIGDWRSPDVIRFAPVPLYNSFEDVYRCGEELSKALKHVYQN